MASTATMAQPTATPQKTVLQRIFDLDVAPMLRPSYPPISSLPRTSPSRLAECVPSPCPEESLPSRSPAALALSPHPDEANTVLYLAYGSNLSAETFLGNRGIRPLSSVNVSAPSLRLTFNLAGIPYREPCFANTAARKIPGLPDKPPKLPDYPPELPNPPTPNDIERGTSHGDPVWDRGLIGVVYEVTRADYAHIVATEGGGASYADILVPCLPLPKPRIGVPEKPPSPPEIPRPFLAHTLCAPRLPEVPDKPDSEREGPKIPGWALKYLRPVQRPDPEYAQPSLRYLKLLRDGAAEHQLPGEYQAWLGALAAYTITSTRQKLGQAVLGFVWGPVFLLVVFPLAKLLADDRGRLPLWFAVVMGALSGLVWRSYDLVMKPVFGDGERTEEEEDGKGGLKERGMRAKGEGRPLLS